MKHLEPTLADDDETSRRKPQIEALLRAVGPDEDLPWFLSDEASLLDASSLMPEELLERLNHHASSNFDLGALRIPLWQLVERVELAKALAEGSRRR